MATPPHPRNLIDQTWRLDWRTLNAILPAATPAERDSALEQFRTWLHQQQPHHPTWQAAWNTYLGQRRYVRTGHMRCDSCSGRGFRFDRPNPICTTCMGRRNVPPTTIAANPAVEP